MKFAFWKMHGAGNDFILIDDRDLTFPAGNTGAIARVSVRRTGVGCEGVILIQPSQKADFRMRFFNPDGNEVEMCGNGARCVASLAHQIGVASSPMTIDTVAGVLTADLVGEQVRLHMTDPHGWRMGQEMVVGGLLRSYGFVNTGVPHAVLECDDIERCDVQALGSEIRHHANFAPQGTNANFFVITGGSSLSIRTYERGVEDETLACGTGIVATALIEARSGRVEMPVVVSARGGYELTVDGRLTDDGAESVTLLGPAQMVFQGTVHL